MMIIFLAVSVFVFSLKPLCYFPLPCCFKITIQLWYTRLETSSFPCHQCKRESARVPPQLLWLPFGLILLTAWLHFVNITFNVLLQHVVLFIKKESEKTKYTNVWHKLYIIIFFSFTCFSNNHAYHFHQRSYFTREFSGSNKHTPLLFLFYFTNNNDKRKGRKNFSELYIFQAEREKNCAWRVGTIITPHNIPLSRL